MALISSTKRSVKEQNACDVSQNLSDVREKKKEDSPGDDTKASNKNKVSATNEVTVAGTRNTGGKRVWDKMHYCVYCCEKIKKMARHLLACHAEEKEVAQITAIEVEEGDSDKLKLEKRHERKRLFYKLRNVEIFSITLW